MEAFLCVVRDLSDETITIVTELATDKTDAAAEALATIMQLDEPPPSEATGDEQWTLETCEGYRVEAVFSEGDLIAMLEAVRERRKGGRGDVPLP